MRLDRICRLVGNSLVVLAVSAAAAPALAQTPYDGLWNVTVVTKSGSCEPSARFPIVVTDGKVSAVGADVSGVVGREGNVRVSIGPAYATVS